MFTHITEIRVRYGETDQMGYLYHGFYASYYDVGRTEAIRSLGIIYADMEEEGMLMPVLSLKSKYVRPAKYDELLQVETTLVNFPDNGLLNFRTEISNQEGDLLNVGEVTLVCVNALTRKRCNPKAYLLKKLRPYFEN